MPRSFAFTFMSPLRNLSVPIVLPTPPDTDRCPATLYLDGSRLAAPYHGTTNLANRSNLLLLLFLFPIPRLSNPSPPPSRVSLPRLRDYRGESKRIIKRFRAEKELQSYDYYGERNDCLRICREDRVTNARLRGIGEHIQLEIAAG